MIVVGCACRFSLGDARLGVIVAVVAVIMVAVIMVAVTMVAVTMMMVMVMRLCHA